MTRIPEEEGQSELRRESRHQALARDFREQIRLGRLLPGDRLPSFNELRERWGAGQDTIERMYAALESDGLVAREPRRGVFVLAPRQKKTGTVGFINSPYSQEHPYYSQLLAGVLEEARRAEVEVLMLLLGEKPARWEKVDGILYPATMSVDMQQPGVMPRVALIYAERNVSSVVADDYVGFREAMEYLWTLGHRRIAFLTSELQVHAHSRRRLDAYRDTYLEKGIMPVAGLVRMMSNPGTERLVWEDLAHRDMLRWLGEDWDDLDPTAILATNDESATGLIRALQESGRSVPGDVSVVGFDGTEIARYHRPRLTTVKAPLREIGAAGLRLLMEQIARPIYELGEYEPRCVVLPTQFQPGESTTSPKNRVTNSKE